MSDAPPAWNRARRIHSEKQINLVSQHFMTLPSIIRATNLCAIVPDTTVSEFNRHGEFAYIEPLDLPLRNFTVSLYWSRRFEQDAGIIWFRNLASQLFARSPYGGKGGK